jgi:hypothetical protein
VFINEESGEQNFSESNFFISEGELCNSDNSDGVTFIQSCP